MVNGIVITLALSVGLGLGWRYLRKGKKKLGLPLLYAQVYALRAQHATMQVGDVIARVPIEIGSNVERVKVTLQTFARGPRRGDMGNG